jgi:Tfp pilus assembly protein PilV
MRSPRLPLFAGLSAASGFSLVEVLIATGLLATAIASLAHLFAVATRANLDAGDTTWATVLAAQKIEELRAEPFPELFVEQSVDYLDSGGNRLDDPGSTRRAYTRRWSIEPLSSAPDNTIAITVGVSRYRRGDGDTLDSTARRRDAARLVTLRTRKAP